MKNMLVYHPAFDLYNCIFRMLCLLDASPEDEIPFDKLRIWDFYLTFPGEVAKISFPFQLRSQRAVFVDAGNNVYEKLNNRNRIFERMHSYQHSAIRCLASYGFVDAGALNKNLVKRTNKKYPDNIKAEISEISPIKKSAIDLLVKDFLYLPLFGKDGLKDRTRLIPFKYDPRS